MAVNDRRAPTDPPTGNVEEFTDVVGPLPVRRSRSPSGCGAIIGPLGRTRFARWSVFDIETDSNRRVAVLSEAENHRSAELSDVRELVVAAVRTLRRTRDEHHATFVAFVQVWPRLLLVLLVGIGSRRRKETFHLVDDYGQRSLQRLPLLTAAIKSFLPRRQPDTLDGLLLRPCQISPELPFASTSVSKAGRFRTAHSPSSDPVRGPQSSSGRGSATNDSWTMLNGSYTDWWH